MKKIITALDNQNVNTELSKLKNYKIITKDISYQDGIFEILEKENPDILLLSEILPGPNNIKNLIMKIKKQKPNLEIIIFLEKENNDLIQFLKINDIYNIFYNNKITIEELIKKFENNNQIIKTENKINQKDGKILSFIGPSGSGKTILSAMLAKKTSENKKVLILDFDLLNKDINLIIKKNKNLNIILGKDILFENENMEFNKIKKLIEEYKKDYDLIIINTSSECYFKLNKNLIKISDKNLFVTGTNIIEIKKSKTLLKIYISEWKINPEKINIIFNKYDKYSIDEKILNNIFKKYNIIGKVKFNGNYKFLLNDNFLQKLKI